METVDHFYCSWKEAVYAVYLNKELLWVICNWGESNDIEI